MQMTIDVAGLDSAMRLAQSVSGAPKIGQRGLRKWAERVVTKIKDEFAPVGPHGGHLRSTIHVEQDDTGVEIVAGGPSAPYAREVHEDFSWHKANVPGWPSEIHWTKAGTGPKYIERPAIAALPDAVPSIMAEIEKQAAKNAAG